MTKIKVSTAVRQRFNSVCQSLIRLVMATGVCFTVTACYGPPLEDREGWNEPIAPMDSTQNDSTSTTRHTQQRLLEERVEQMAQQQANLE